MPTEKRFFGYNAKKKRFPSKWLKQKPKTPTLGIKRAFVVTMKNDRRFRQLKIIKL